PIAKAGVRRNIQWQVLELPWKMPAQNHTPAEPLDQVAQIHKDRSSNGRVQPAEVSGSPGRGHRPRGLSRRRPRLVQVAPEPGGNAWRSVLPKTCFAPLRGLPSP